MIAYQLAGLLLTTSLSTGGTIRQPIAEQTSFTIQLLDAKSGKPVGSNHLLLFTGATPQDVQFQKGHAEAKTDANGLTVVTLNLKLVEFAQVWVDFHSLCEKHPNLQSVSLLEAHAHGLVLNECSTLRVQAKPDYLTIYVRAETLSEKMGH